LLLWGTGYNIFQNISKNLATNSTTDKNSILVAEYGLRNFGFRERKPSRKRFPSVDTLTKSYPKRTLYPFASNMPIVAIGWEVLEFTSMPDYEHIVFGYKTKWQNGQWHQNLYNEEFDKACEYNTKQSLYGVYKPVQEIHKYYVWTAKEIEKRNIPIRFFHAARDVTNIYGVGGAYTAPEFVTGLSDHGRKSLADVNKHLLKVNIDVINKLLYANLQKDIKYAILWDFEYVHTEQNALTQVIEADPLSLADITAINNNFSRFESWHPEYALAKELLAVPKLDYKPQRQRMAIGRSMVYMHHMKRKNLTNEERQKGIDFLIKEYGQENVDNFLKKYDKIIESRVFFYIIRTFSLFTLCFLCIGAIKYSVFFSISKH
jgi:hypothetical protein